MAILPARRHTLHAISLSCHDTRSRDTTTLHGFTRDPRMTYAGGLLMAATMLALVTFPLWPPRRAVHPRTDAWPRRCLLWTGDRKTDILRDHCRRRASRYLFGYSPKRVADVGVVSVVTHIRRLTRRCHRSNHSSRRGSGVFQRKRAVRRRRARRQLDRKSEQGTTVLILKRSSRVLASWQSVRAGGGGTGRGSVKRAREGVFARFARDMF